MMTVRRKFVLLFLLVMAALPTTAGAHVKWFSNFNFADVPQTIGEALTPTLIGLAVLSAVALAVLVPIDRFLHGQGWYRRVEDWFENRKQYSRLVMRIGLGASLLMAWQAQALLVPRLSYEMAWVGWFQFLLIFLLFFDKTVIFAGFGVLLLYVLGILQYGLFYMLDYVLFVGVAYYLIVGVFRNPTMRGTAIPALYFTTGFSLIWVGLEKIFYPQWGLYILQQNPQLALGFPIEFFLVAAAFVELVLGYLLIIGLLERPLALVVTLVFFTTTTIFGRVEVIGHTIIHAALIVFLLEGPGDIYKAPIAFHRKTPLRMAFAGINFLLLIGILFIPYRWGAMMTYEHAAAEALERAESEVAYDEPVFTVPTVDFDVSHSASTSWILTIDAPGFEFTSPEETDEMVMGQGHAYIYIDGQLVGIAYEDTYQLRNLPDGTYEIRVTLHANDGSVYTVGDGEALSVMREVELVR